MSNEHHNKIQSQDDILGMNKDTEDLPDESTDKDTDKASPSNFTMGDSIPMQQFEDFIRSQIKNEINLQEQKMLGKVESTEIENILIKNQGLNSDLYKIFSFAVIFVVVVVLILSIIFSYIRKNSSDILSVTQNELSETKEKIADLDNKLHDANKQINDKIEENKIYRKQIEELNKLKKQTTIIPHDPNTQEKKNIIHKPHKTRPKS